jgi:thymidylate synthase (FAD)
MKIINPSTRLYVNGQPLAWKYGIDMLKAIERIGRTCYKSEDKITDDSYETFVRNLIKRGHLSVIEHCSVTADIICDRGVTHEIVRHRIGSYSQESTRYCNYAGGKYDSSITVIVPVSAFGWDIVNNDEDAAKYRVWCQECARSEAAYMDMIRAGASPQEARGILPNSLKTEIWVTYNLREGRHFFHLRCAPAAHPQMQEVARMLLAEMTAYVPIIFDDIYEEVFHRNE